MKKTFGLTALLGGVLLTSLVAGPAQAAPETLPSTQHVYAIDSANHYGMVWQLDPATAGGVKVGTSTGSPDGTDFTPSAIDAAAYNPVTKKSYIIAEDSSGKQALYSVNLSTGVSVYIATFVNVQDFIQGFAIDNSGHAWVNGSDGDGNRVLVSLDLETGAISYDNAVIISGANYWFTTFAYDIKNSAMYLFMQDPGSSNYLVFTVDMSTGNATQVYEFTNIPTVATTLTDGNATGTNVRRVAFDDNGNAWLTLQNNGTGVYGGSSTALATWNPISQVLTPIANIYDPSDVTYSYAANEFYAPVLLLSHTGADVVAPTPTPSGGGVKPVVIKLKVAKKLAIRTVATKLGLKVTTKSTATLVIAKASKKYCKIVKTNLVGVKKGACKVTVTVKTGKTKKSKTGTVTIIK